MPRFNWQPESVAFIDLETQSAANLNVLGGSLYLRHPTTRLMSAVVKDDEFIHVWVPICKYDLTADADSLWPEWMQRAGEKIKVWQCEWIPEAIRRLIARNTLVAHNAEGFDAYAWETLTGDTSATWFDTMPICKASGLPSSLDALGHIFAGHGKDEGKEALKLLYTAKIGRDGSVNYTVGTKPLWLDMLRYNVADVLLLERVFFATVDEGEPDVLAVNSAINNRGVRVDRELAYTLQELWQQATEKALGRIEELTHGEIQNIRSGPQVKAWLQKQGCRVESLDRKLLEQLYAEPEEFFDNECIDERTALVVEVLKLRQLATRVVTGKLERLTEMVDADNRVRNLFVYCGAFTGRWSGRGLQPHNMPRPLKGLDVEGLLSEPLTLERVQEYANKAKGSLDDALSSLFRPVFCADDGKTLAIADYAAIEGRGVAWVGEEQKLLDIFSDPKGDVYCEMASKLYGREITKANDAERFIGKQIVLGCGYGMSAPKFDMMMAIYRIKLSDANTTAEACVKAYREAFPGVVNVWRSIGRAAMDATRNRGRQYHAGRCVFEHDGKTLRITLPSGRNLTYRGCRIERRIPAYQLIYGHKAREVDTLVYLHPHGHYKVIYGGLLTENIVQAISRDLLATALVRIDPRLPVVCHVHDEIVCEVGNAFPAMSLEWMAKTMTEPPAWAEGFPIRVEGFTNRRYTKAPYGDSFRVDAMGGKILHRV